MMTTDTATATLERRIRHLEEVLGLSPFVGLGRGGDDEAGASVLGSSSNPEELVMRLARLERQLQGSYPRTLNDEWTAIQKLETKLGLSKDGSYTQSPVSAVSIPPNTSPASAPADMKPLLYKKEEILASRADLRRSMERLGQVQDILLRPSQNSSSSSAEASNSTTVSSLAESPILTSNKYRAATLPTMQSRLDDVTVRVGGLARRTEHVRERVDDVVRRYHEVMMLVSEKMVLAEEQLSYEEQQRRRAQVQ